MGTINSLLEAKQASFQQKIDEARHTGGEIITDNGGADDCSKRKGSRVDKQRVRCHICLAAVVLTKECEGTTSQSSACESTLKFLKKN